MSEATVKIDEKGRVTIPQQIRKAAKIKTKTFLTVKAKDNVIIIEPAESTAKKYAGIFQITEWPEDLDEFTVEAASKWWKTHSAT
jgi:AbrB family looped-hinge helix DNA binding protein